MTPKQERTDAGNLDASQRNCKVLPSSEKVKVLDVIVKEKESHADTQ